MKRFATRADNIATGTLDGNLSLGEIRSKKERYQFGSTQRKKKAAKIEVLEEIELVSNPELRLLQIRAGHVEEFDTPTHAEAAAELARLFDNVDHEQYDPDADRLDEIAEESAAIYNRNTPAEPLPEEPEEMPAPWAYEERKYVNDKMGRVLTDYEWARYLEMLTGYMAQQNAIEMRAGGKLDHLR